MIELSPQLMHLWARWCAREVFRLWWPPEVVYEWIDRGSEDLRRAAFASASNMSRSEAGGPASPGGDAELLGALRYHGAAAARVTALALPSARIATAAAASARLAAIAAREDGITIAKARVGEKHRQQFAKTLINDLSDALTDLSSLRLDIAHSDPWLTREVWRALRLPDLQFVEDWYIWTQEQVA